MKAFSISLLSAVLFLFISCKDQGSSLDSTSVVPTSEQNTAACLAKMNEHLAAVSNRDLATLEKTLSPNGDMLLILPKTETITGVDGFMKYHQEWFEYPNWTFTTSIVDSEVTNDMGFVIVESMYREPERDGVPYYNRMTISYVLQKINNVWYVVKDHATSVEKSTDPSN